MDTRGHELGSQCHASKERTGSAYPSVTCLEGILRSRYVRTVRCLVNAPVEKGVRMGKGWMLAMSSLAVTSHLPPNWIC